MTHRKLAVLAATGGLAVATVIAAAPAQAWPTSSTVMTYGDDGCEGAQTASVYALAPNGEFVSGQFGFWGGYSLTFHRVPVGGESVRFDVYCGASGHHTSVRWVSRPNVGTSLNVNL